MSVLPTKYYQCLSPHMVFTVSTPQIRATSHCRCCRHFKGKIVWDLCMPYQMRRISDTRKVIQEWRCTLVSDLFTDIIWCLVCKLMTLYVPVTYNCSNCANSKDLQLQILSLDKCHVMIQCMYCNYHKNYVSDETLHA